MLLKEWLEETGFNSLEEAKNSGCFHFEDTERDMQVWYLRRIAVKPLTLVMGI
ncbi:MAG: hypothetical protein ACLT40_06195 [Fusobacterium sp.]